jgi:hypothetical protein
MFVTYIAKLDVRRTFAVADTPDLCLLKNEESNGEIGFPIFSSFDHAG